MEYEADKRSYRVLKLFETLQKLGQGAALDRKEFAEEMGAVSYTHLTLPTIRLV